MEYDPDFKAPGYPVVPLLGGVLSFGLIAFMAPIEILLSAGFVVFGVVWYGAYARNTAEKRGALFEHILAREASFPKPIVAVAVAIDPSSDVETGREDVKSGAGDD